jgi:hypothetical protein
LEHVAIAPFADSRKGFCGDIFKDVLQPYFLDKDRPIHRGDIFIASTTDKETLLQFEVIAMEGDMKLDYGIVSGETTIHCECSPVERKPPHDSGRYSAPVTQVPFYKLQELVSLSKNCLKYKYSTYYSLSECCDFFFFLKKKKDPAVSLTTTTTSNFFN